VLLGTANHQGICVEIATLSFVINGEPNDFVRPSRCSRQGDSLFHTCSFVALKIYHIYSRM